MTHRSRFKFGLDVGRVMRRLRTPGSSDSFGLEDGTGWVIGRSPQTSLDNTRSKVVHRAGDH